LFCRVATGCEEERAVLKKREIPVADREVEAIEGELLKIQNQLMARHSVAGVVGGGADAMSDDVSAMSISVQGAFDDMSGVSRTLSNMSGVEVYHDVEEKAVLLYRS